MAAEAGASGSSAMVMHHGKNEPVKDGLTVTSRCKADHPDVNPLCALCVRDCKQSSQVVVHSCAKFSKQLTLDDELRAYNRRQARKPRVGRSRGRGEKG